MPSVREWGTFARIGTRTDCVLLTGVVTLDPSSAGLFTDALPGCPRSRGGDGRGGPEMEGIGNPFGKHPMPHHSNQIHGHDPERVTRALLSAVHPPIGVTVGLARLRFAAERVVHAWMGTAAASISETQELLMRKERKRELPYLFDPFRRAKTSDRSAARLGLGLYIVSKVSGARDGSVNVTSDEGGTMFTATLSKTRAPSSGGAP